MGSGFAVRHPTAKFPEIDIGAGQGAASRGRRTGPTDPEVATGLVRFADLLGVLQNTKLLLGFGMLILARIALLRFSLM